MDKLPRIGLPIVIIIIIGLIVVFKSTVTIDAGYAGVLYHTLGDGVDSDEPALGQGLNFIAPWNKVIVYEIRQQQIPETMSVLSSNGLDIKLDASVLYQPDVANLGKLHNEKSKDYLNRVLQPAIRSAARSVVGRYTPEQLYSSKRDAIQNEIFEETKKIVEGQYIQLNSILIRDVTLPNTIKEAIERKLKQEQESLEYEFRLVTAQKEAEKVRIEAQGKADANRILSASLTDKILQDKGIEATLKLSESPNSKVVVIGSGDEGLPIILGNN
ncbi:prohibitin family protein [Flavobacteriaceae bacterium R38]|nr:prohibitin family protein [Flavobacteriaceae bacterium R38]